MNNNAEQYWTAFYTKPRNEKSVAKRLANAGFDIYCPTRTVLKQWSDRKKKVQEPVFSSYVFARVDEPTRTMILRDAGIVANVYWLGRPAVVRDEEIEQIKAFLEEYTDSELSVGAFKVGDNIRIESGPLSGQDGVLGRINGNRAYLSINSLGIEIRAEIGLNHLKKVG